ncbi:MAG TPA: GMP synthase, partial [Pelotomaculum sp.]|nr:GMP synthase [Pelotomaculum sp.]
KWIHAWSDELQEENGFGAVENVIQKTGSIWSTYRQLANQILKNWLAGM